MLGQCLPGSGRRRPDREGGVMASFLAAGEGALPALGTRPGVDA